MEVLAAGYQLSALSSPMTPCAVLEEPEYMASSASLSTDLFHGHYIPSIDHEVHVIARSYRDPRSLDNLTRTVGSLYIHY